MSCGFCAVPALAADRRWANSITAAGQWGTQQPCDLTQRRCRRQTFRGNGRTPIFGGFNLRGSIMRRPRYDRAQAALVAAQA